MAKERGFREDTLKEQDTKFERSNDGQSRPPYAPGSQAGQRSQQQWHASQRRGGGKKQGRGGGISSSPMRQARLKPPRTQDLDVLANGMPIHLLSSPSRGQDGHLDASQNLTDTNMQERFRLYIDQAVRDHANRFGALLSGDGKELFPVLAPLPASTSSASAYAASGLTSDALHSLQQIMLLVRRLREACVAARRHDGFVREVCTLSTLMSILVGDNVQLTSSISRWLELFEQSDIDRGSSASQNCSTLDTILHGETPGEAARQTHIAIDLDLARSLSLLWLSISGGQVERIGGKQGVLRARPSSLAFHTLRQSISGDTAGPHVHFADRCQKALARDDIATLRLLLIEARSSNIWHAAILRRCVDERRTLAWTTLQKAYLHLAVDASLIDVDKGPLSFAIGPNDWVEQMLLIDIDVMRPTAEELADSQRGKSVSARSADEIPDEWDQSTGDSEVRDLQKALESATLGEDVSDGLKEIRAKRLAHALSVYGLSEAPAKSTFGGHMDRWGDRVVLQAARPVLKLR